MSFTMSLVPLGLYSTQLTQLYVEIQMRWAVGEL